MWCVVAVSYKRPFSKTKREMQLPKTAGKQTFNNIYQTAGYLSMVISRPGHFVFSPPEWYSWSRLQ
jgi:hypothetical protein